MAAGLSQQKLAETVGMSLPIVSRWERDKNVPGRESATLVDEALGAGGEILAAFGYAPIQPDPLAELRSQVADLYERVGQLSARLAATGAEVARLRGRRRQGGDR
jgi:transcriptional regulator with XRE-family HTH domain